MHKLIKILFSIFVSIGIAACTPKTIYIEPEMIGEIYNDKTKKPIANTQGYIAYSTTRDQTTLVDIARFEI